MFFYTKQKSNISLISDLTKLPNISYSTSFWEPRIKEYRDFSQTIFIKQKDISYMDFIYEK